MRIYVAHNFAAREWLPTVIAQITEAGHESTSRWITDPSHVGVSQQAALADLGDIDRSNCLVLFVDQYGPTPGKGKYVELGYAYAQGKRIILVGKDTQNVFYALPGVERVADVPELLKKLHKQAEELVHE
jgi:nucleoside 2-deoxyribosyltransferase